MSPERRSNEAAVRGVVRLGGAVLGLVLGLAACGSGPEFDAGSFPGGVLTVAYGGEQMLIFVDPDASLAGAEGAAVEEFRLGRNGLRFAAMPDDGRALAFELPAADVGPDFSGSYAVRGDCSANCTGPATAWWSQGHDRVALPAG